MVDEWNRVCPEMMRNMRHTNNEIHSLAINLLVRCRVFPPGLLFQSRIILWHGTVQEVTGIEIEELGIGELSQLICNVVIVLLLLMLLLLLLGCGLMGGRKSIEIGEEVRDVGCFPSFVTFHGSHGEREWLCVCVCVCVCRL